MPTETAVLLLLQRLQMAQMVVVMVVASGRQRKLVQLTASLTPSPLPPPLRLAETVLLPPRPLRACTRGMTAVLALLPTAVLPLLSLLAVMAAILG